MKLCSDDVWSSNPVARFANERCNGSFYLYTKIYLAAADVWLQFRNRDDIATIVSDYHRARQFTDFRNTQSCNGAIRRLMRCGIDLRLIPYTIGATEAEIATNYCRNFGPLSFDELVALQDDVKNPDFGRMDIVHNHRVSQHVVNGMAVVVGRKFPGFVHKTTSQTRKQIIACVEEGAKTYREIADDFGIDHTYVHKIWKQREQ